jgi:DNA polymerase-4
MEAYRAESERIMAILGRHTPLLERVSVDEAYLDMSQWCAGAPSPDAALLGLASVAEAIRREIRDLCGLTASVGVATNKFLAKLGSDLDKPNGLTVIPEEGKSLFLRPLSVRRIHGVGPVTASGLEAQGLQLAGKQGVLLGQGGGFVGLHVAHRLAEGFIRTGKPKQQFVAMDGNGAQFHHAPHH